MTAAHKLTSYPADPDSLSREEIDAYDTIIVAFSGGKDSVACVLHLLDMGVDPAKIELWHHDIDGREGSDLFDWPVTRAYCKAFADAFNLKIYFSWKMGGFEREMTRQNARTAPTKFECPDGSVKQAGGTRGKLSTRMLFPQVSADLSVRWCSAYLKIDVATTAINNQERFLDSRTLLVTGERAEEGRVTKEGKAIGRAAYKVLEPHKSDNRNGKRVRRHVDQWRPVHKWTEAEVWAIIEAYRVNPHPCYKLGFGRCSCMACIFGNADQWATVKKLDSDRFDRLTAYEDSFERTMKRKKSLRVVASEGTAYRMKAADMTAAMRDAFHQNIIMAPGKWTLPAGAFGDTCGPM